SGTVLARPKTHPQRSSPSSTGRSMRDSPIPSSKRGLPIWAKLSLVARPPHLESSLSRKPRSGPRSSSSPAPRRTDPANIRVVIPYETGWPALQVAKPVFRPADFHARLVFGRRSYSGGKALAAPLRRTRVLPCARGVDQHPVPAAVAELGH